MIFGLTDQIVIIGVVIICIIVAIGNYEDKKCLKVWTDE